MSTIGQSPVYGSIGGIVDTNPNQQLCIEVFNCWLVLITLVFQIAQFHPTSGELSFQSIQP